MLTTKNFWWGVVAGVAGVWAWHAFAKPLPSPKTNGKGM